MSLREKFDAMKADLESMPPAEALAIRQRLADELIEAEPIVRASKVGDGAPHFSLPDPNGTLVSSAELLQQGPLVVTFYRGIWCPYCVVDLQAVEGVCGEIRSTGATIVAIAHQVGSRDQLSAHVSSLSFPLLEDADGDVAVGFGIRWAPDDLASIEEHFGTELIRFVGGLSWILPMQARFVIGQQGIIAYADVAFSYDDRSEPAEFLPVLGRMKPRSP